MKNLKKEKDTVIKAAIISLIGTICLAVSPIIIKMMDETERMRELAINQTVMASTPQQMAPATGERVTVTIHVLDEEPQAVMGAEVLVFAGGTSYPKELTDENGNVQVQIEHKDSQSLLTIEVFKEGYKPGRQTINLGAFSNIPTIDFQLKQK